MDILFLLIPLGVALVFLIGAIFWWAIKSGQFDDLEGPGFRVIQDDDHPASSNLLWQIHDRADGVKPKQHQPGSHMCT